MKILLAALDSPGHVFPAIRLAQELKRRGHDAWLVTHERWGEVAKKAGVERLPREAPNDGPSFNLEGWGKPESVALQMLHLENAIRQVQPDLLVGNPLILSTHIARQEFGLPLVQLGFATMLWGPEGGDDEAAHHARGMLQRLAEARAFLGLPKQKELDWKYLLGDLFLLRSLPELEGAPVWSDDDPVEFVGDLLWELESEVGASLTAFLEAARAQGKTIIYAQPGRTFDLPPTWPKIIEALRGNSFAVIADLTRLDGEAGDCPANFFMTDSAKQPVYLGQVLPHVDLPITGGHTTTALGALKYGKPQLMIAYGSGSGAIARKYAGAGIALHLDARTVMAEQISAGIDKLINESRFGERTAQLSTQLKSTGDFGRAAELIEAKFGGE